MNDELVDLVMRHVVLGPDALTVREKLAALRLLVREQSELRERGLDHEIFEWHAAIRETVVH